MSHHRAKGLQDALRATTGGFERLTLKRKQRRTQRRKYLQELRATTQHLSQQYQQGTNDPTPLNREPDYAKPIGTKPPRAKTNVPEAQVQEQVRGQQTEAPTGGPKRQETKRKPSTRKSSKGGGK